VELVLHRGSGELATVTGVDLVRSHAPVREDPYRLGVGLVGAEAMLRLFPEQERSPRAFEALTRFLDLLDARPPGADAPGLDPLGLAFQLKLLWVAGYQPHLSACAECGADGPLAGYSPRAGGVLCRSCAGADTLTLSAAGLAAMEALLRRPMAEAGGEPLTARSAREVLSVVTSSYEQHGGFRLRTLSA
jgi:DNA repair protein RecO (recombination protein O)